MDDSCLDCQALGLYGKSRTVQSHRDKCDIPSIVEKYRRTGMMPLMKSNATQMTFGDFTDVQDYQTTCNRVIAAHQAFDGLPVRVRERFRNDPAALLAFLSDPANRVEAISLGLVNEPPAAAADLPVEKAGDVAGTTGK